MGDDASFDDNLQETELNNDNVPVVDIDDDATNNNSSLSLYTLDTSSEIISDTVHNDNNIHNNNDTQNIYNNNNQHSLVWLFFSKLPTNKVQCKTCKQLFSEKSATTTLRRHIEKKHTNIYDRAKQTSLEINRFHPYPTTSPEYKSITNKLIDWLATDLLPFTIVESPYFNKFITLLNGHYKPPSRQTIKKLIIRKFNIKRNNLKCDIEKIPGKVSFTTDIWSSMTNQSYLGITLHYIDNNWNLKNLTLDVIHLEDHHTGNVIADKVFNLLDEFNLTTKVLSFTTDNASNMLKFGEVLIDLLQVYSNHHIMHIRCAAHILNIAVQHGLEIVSNEVVKLRNYVKKIRSSTLLNDELRRIFESKNVQFLAPILDCPTRWNSTYLMINRQRKTMEYNQRLVRTTSSDAILDYPTNDDWNKLNDLYEVLKPIYVATTLLSNTKHPSLGDVRLTFLGILKNLNNIVNNDENEQYIIADSVRHKLQNYWNLVEKNTRICSILDPHSKLRLFFNNVEISGANNDIEELIAEHISNVSSNTINNNHESISHHLYFYNLFTSNDDNSNTNYQNNTNEYNNYLNLPLISDNIKIDTLTWWKAHQEEFPTLAKIAKDYLSIQATSVPSEQLFSLAGHTIRKTRTRLHPETTRACLCLKNWIGNDFGLGGNKDLGEINIDNDIVVEKDDDINCLVYLDE
jgi:hypothetical protein